MNLLHHTYICTLLFMRNSCDEIKCVQWTKTRFWLAIAFIISTDLCVIIYNAQHYKNVLKIMAQHWADLNVMLQSTLFNLHFIHNSRNGFSLTVQQHLCLCVAIVSKSRNWRNVDITSLIGRRWPGTSHYLKLEFLWICKSLGTFGIQVHNCMKYITLCK